MQIKSGLKTLDKTTEKRKEEEEEEGGNKIKIKKLKKYQQFQF
jgi:hypothetical protein